MANPNPKNILIIEDDEQVARVYRVKLEQDGIKSATAGDGEEGLRKIISEKPDLVLLDLMLPKEDGFWVLEELKKKPELKKIPVIVLSNLGQKGDEERALGLGAKDYMIKTDVSIKEVVDKVKKFLG